VSRQPFGKLLLLLLLLLLLADRDCRPRESFPGFAGEGGNCAARGDDAAFGVPNRPHDEISMGGELATLY